MRKFNVLMIVFLFVIYSPYLLALTKQKNTLTNFKVLHTHIDSLVSQSNGIHYNLYIHLPKNYENNNKHYSVIYLLDADYSFLLAKQIVEHLSERNRIEEYIIVGVAYPDFEYKKNRTRDYTPSYVRKGGYGPEYQKYSGGASKFYQFIHGELMPHLANNYRVNKNTTFVGHSFGGLFGLYLLLNYPETFDNYIIVSPSLWYDNHLLLKTVKNKKTLSVKKPI